MALSNQQDIQQKPENPKRDETKKRRFPNWALNLALVLGSFLLCAVLLGLGELFCRAFTRIHLLGNSANLFEHSRFGFGHSNTPRFRGFSFGVEVETDEFGFRIDPETKDPGDGDAVLILGDSVAFGCGVEEKQTFTGMLRRTFPDVRFYNSSSIGYCTHDYQNVVDGFIPSHPEIKKVFLFFCLNDLSPQSALAIEQRLSLRSRGTGFGKGRLTSIRIRFPFNRATMAQDKQTAGQKNAQPTLKPRRESRIVSWARQYPVLENLNSFLRSRSKLYLFVRSFAGNSQLIFQNDHSLYSRGEKYFVENMQPVLDVSQTLRQSGIEFKVFILPYVMQLRFPTETHLKPQTRLSDFFTQHGIDFTNTQDTFRYYENDYRRLYLWDDPMHFSGEGHRILSEIVSLELKSEQARD